MNKEQFQRGAFVLSKEHCIDVVEILYLNGWLTATEIAEDLKIHIATAVKYLTELHEIGIAEKRTREGKYKDALEYRLINSEINLTLNFEQIIAEESKGVIEKAGIIKVKEKVRDDVHYEWDDEKQKILKINIIGAGIRRGIQESIELSTSEGKFLWHTPYPSEEGLSVEQICENAGIKNPVEIKKMLKFVDVLKEKGVIEIL
ncbi:MAG: hypothetical protein BWK75_01740 [Candidatus Altiarchaeales archaeon A3]|nr:MAG: hypothetical protein BWK75_01740 [Candidatus Altiarchaeales archaeon A3]